MYKGDIGGKLLINVGTSLTGATVYFILAKDPDGVLFRYPAAGNCTKETDTQLSYVFVAGDLDVVGIYKIQPYVEWTSWKGRGETNLFEVREHFK